MALTKTNSTDFDSLIIESGSTSKTDVHSDLLEDGSGSVHSFRFDNATGGAGAVSLKMFDQQGATLGTDDPVFSFRIKAGAIQSLLCRSGISFSTALTVNVNDTSGTGHASGGTLSSYSFCIMGS